MRYDALDKPPYAVLANQIHGITGTQPSSILELLLLDACHDAKPQQKILHVARQTLRTGGVVRHCVRQPDDEAVARPHATEQQLDIFIGECEHRARNTLAIGTAIEQVKLLRPQERATANGQFVLRERGVAFGRVPWPLAPTKTRIAPRGKAHLHTTV